MSDFQADYGTHTGIRARLDEFPFRVEFSLEPLIRYWETDLAVDDCLLGSAARIVLERVAKVPALRGPATLDIVRENQDLIDALMIAVFSPTFQEDGYAAALLPFRLQTFFATDSFERVLTNHEGFLKGRIDADAALLAKVRLIHAYSLILQRVYGVEGGIEFPWISIVEDPETGL
jgi:hypothetical protein